MKNKKKTFIVLATMYLLILAILTTSFAWFFINKEITVEYGSEITCEAGSSLQVSLYEGINEETGNEIWSEYSGHIKFKGPSAKMEDITGNGKTLYRPTSLMTNPDTNELIPEGLSEANKVSDSGYGDFIELHIKLRTASVMNVYFGGTSTITPINTSDTDRNVYGDFSKHYIAAAMRVAVLEVADDGSEELKMIWAPHPAVQLYYNKETSKYSLTTFGSYEKYSYYKLNSKTGQIERYYVTQDDYVTKFFVPGSTNTTSSMVNNSPILTKLTPAENEIDEKHLVIRAWFEGTDREADQALGGGQVNMSLKLFGMQEKFDVTEESKKLVDDIKLTKTNSSYKLENISEDLYYSVTGYSWIKYTAEQYSHIDQFIRERQQEVKVYFKAPETALNYEYIKSFTIPYTGGESNEA